MKHITQFTTGGPEVLTLAEAPDPAPGPGQLLVRIAAAGINPVDAYVRSGGYKLLGEPPFTIGWDIAGTVEAIGPGTTGFAPGDRVFGMPGFPGNAAAYAEKTVAAAAELARTPAALTDAEAGALPLAGLTAWQALVSHGKLKAGEKVLIPSGAGGVGHLAVQIAKALGAHVTATASAGKLDIVRSLGADRVLDYRKDDLAIPGGYDLVLDPQADTEAEKSVALARDGGRLVALLNPSEAAKAAAEAKRVTLTRMSVRPDAAGLRALADLAAQGKLKVLVAKAFPLAEAGAAQTFLAEARPAGKVVLLT